MNVQWLNDRDRQIMELWLAGQRRIDIRIALKISKWSAVVRDTIARYCDRTRVYSKDGRGWWYRIERKIHPSAPLTPEMIDDLWPPPFISYNTSTDEGRSAELVKAVLDAADAFNEALHDLEEGDAHYGNPEVPNMRVVCSLFQGRLYVSIDDEDYRLQPAPQARGRCDRKPSDEA